VRGATPGAKQPRELTEWTCGIDRVPIWRKRYQDSGCKNAHKKSGRRDPMSRMAIRCVAPRLLAMLASLFSDPGVHAIQYEGTPAVMRPLFFISTMRVRWYWK
jgi:hypothetical protein